MAKFSITRHISIDAGHRIPNHASKCRSIHGHTYHIYATIEGELAREGSEEGMAGGIDFGFLKDLMMDNIDKFCDHGLILSINDPLVEMFFNYCKNRCIKIGLYPESFCGKLYLMNEIPTAENLAKHWYDCLYSRVFDHSKGQAVLTEIRVDETPNCSAKYPA